MKRLKFAKLKGKKNPNTDSIYMDIHDKHLIENTDGSCNIICDSIEEYQQVFGFFRRYILMSMEEDKNKRSVFIPAGYIYSIIKTLGV